ncbi:hypothetical protein M885DRAFT_520525 [Pelagophyceae sp. CCMP2097]|nr:hypothetical protein M885DRAFT_520525 [Pelagophyceae sp. CCMP2097]
MPSCAVRAALGHSAMFLISVALGGAVLVCEGIRVVLYGALPKRSRGGASLTVLVDGDCAVCNTLRSFVAFRLRDPSAAHTVVTFVPAQRVSAGSDDEARLAAAAILRAGVRCDGGTLLQRLHLIEHARPLCEAPPSEVHVGAQAVLRLFDECHAPYPALAALGRIAPQWLVDSAYDAFADRRKAWYGRRALFPVARVVDARQQTRLVVDEAAVAAAAAVATLVCVVLPLGDGLKDGRWQALARFACVVLGFLLLAREVLSYDAARPADAAFFDKFVGRASDKSLAVMRICASGILLVFTLDLVTAPLEETAKVPRFMCMPTGAAAFARFAGHALTGSTDGFDLCLLGADALRRVEFVTRLALVASACGAATRFSTATACISWLFYGAVVRSYNTWRGHSFIAAFWTLAILAWRGGAGAWSVDAAVAAAWRRRGGRFEAPYVDDLRAGAATKAKKDLSVREPRRDDDFFVAREPRRDKPAASRFDDVGRGWTRFACTLIVANNYFMAGLSKLCASGVAWASGSNLKAKLLQTTLAQAPFGIHLSLALRHLPLPFWTALGSAGLYGELAMGLVPFWSVAKVLMPVSMWGMHLGIVLLQHIVFVDLLLMIPAWYVVHAVDHQKPGNALWHWRSVLRDAKKSCGFSVAPEAPPSPASAASDDENARGDAGSDIEVPLLAAAPPRAAPQPTSLGRVVHARHAREVRSGAWFISGLGLMFVCVWTRGAEWYPYNAFRMFADWTPAPVHYERFVTLDAHGVRGRNFHMHELNAILNRKRFKDALELCAATPRHAHCVEFLDFAAAVDWPGGRPAKLQMQTRKWDFNKDIDSPQFCDSMDTLTLDIAMRKVAGATEVACDEIDWRACCAKTLGTI